MKKENAVKLFKGATDILAVLDVNKLNESETAHNAANISFEEIDAMHTTLVAAVAVLVCVEEMSAEDFLVRLLGTHRAGKRL